LFGETEQEKEIDQHVFLSPHDCYGYLTERNKPSRVINKH
jgi:hypothetical protein